MRQGAKEAKILQPESHPTADIYAPSSKMFVLWGKQEERYVEASKRKKKKKWAGGGGLTRR